MATFSTCNCAVNREAAGAMLHFKETFTYAGEDELLSRSISAVKPVLYNPDAIVRHKPRDSFRGVFQWFTRRGLAGVEMLAYSSRKGPSIRRMLYTSFLLRVSIVLTLALLLPMPACGFLGGVFAVYYSSIIWRYRWSRKYFTSLKTTVILPLVKAVMDFGMDVGICRALMAGKK
jgi:hypothetical protein